MLNDGKNTKFLIVLIFSLFLALSGCKSSQKVPKEVRDAEKAEMEMENEIQKEYDKVITNFKKKWESQQQLHQNCNERVPDRMVGRG